MCQIILAIGSFPILTHYMCEHPLILWGMSNSYCSYLRAQPYCYNELSWTFFTHFVPFNLFDMSTVQYIGYVQKWVYA